MSSAFVQFAKIGRLKRGMVITEKIDGTNAQILIEACADLSNGGDCADGLIAVNHELELSMFAGSRNRYLTPEADNFGFARWVNTYANALWALGPGRHFGEWWGSGVQRGYGLTNGEKRFSLFNTGRWNGDRPPPACCRIVPVLHTGMFDTAVIDEVIADLARTGSRAAPGFSRPEGIVIFQSATGTLFKRTIDHDDEPKGAQHERI